MLVEEIIGAAILARRDRRGCRRARRLSRKPLRRQCEQLQLIALAGAVALPLRMSPRHNGSCPEYAMIRSPCSCYVLYRALPLDRWQAQNPGPFAARRSTARARASTCPRPQADGDWLDARETLDGARRHVRTTVTVEQPRTIITRNKSPDVPFDRSINPYRGCEHGCIYCFARPSHAFHDLSPGLDFETQAVRQAERRRPCCAPNWPSPATSCQPIALGTNTDPYQPIESEWRITRAGARGAGRVRPPGDDHDQVRPRRPRHRPARADGGKGAGRGGDFDHLARSARSR